MCVFSAATACLQDRVAVGVAGAAVLGSRQLGVRDKSFSKCLVSKEVRPIKNNAEKRISINF